jgi:hypothetical protein
MARTKKAATDAAKPKKPTTRKKRETKRQEPEHVHLLDRTLTPAAPTPPELPDPIEMLRAEMPVIERNQESGRYSRVVLQTLVLSEIVRREDSPFIYNEVEDYDGTVKLIGHYKIKGVPRPKEHRHDTAR